MWHELDKQNITNSAWEETAPLSCDVSTFPMMLISCLGSAVEWGNISNNLQNL